jgi:Domain of unknown function (DUF4159)
MKLKNIFLLIAIFLLTSSFSTNPPLKLGLLKYNGGGDWYANPTSLPNLAVFIKQQLNINVDAEQVVVEVGSPDLFNFAFVHTTGHGNITLSDAEAKNMRQWLTAGGFWHIDDNYGIDPYIRPALKKVFPECELIELPFTHPIYHQKFNFNNGLPKIHEHDGKPPKGWGLIYQGRLVVFYSYECDLGDGWEDITVHKDTPEKHLAALQMGANIIQYAFLH